MSGIQSWLSRLLQWAWVNSLVLFSPTHIDCLLDSNWLHSITVALLCDHSMAGLKTQSSTQLIKLRLWGRKTGELLMKSWGVREYSGHHISDQVSYITLVPSSLLHVPNRYMWNSILGAVLLCSWVVSKAEPSWSTHSGQGPVML